MNIDEPLTRIKADGTVRHYVTDALGSVIALTDDSGVTKTTYTYDPFGNVTISGEASDNPLQYTGRENDGTGLYYYRARYYSPELQRWISEDPIGLEGGINLYSYVGNRPTGFIDPMGLPALFWHEGITYVAARDSGYGVMDSLRLAVNAAAVDFSGTQGKSSADTVQHAMAAAVGQISAESIAATNAYIQANINNGNLAGAIHAAQDSATPGHAGQPWHGFNWDWETAKHILGDVFPSWGTIKQAYQHTKGILNPKGCSK